MEFTNIIFELAAIVVGAGLLATLFLFARQPILLAYIAVGILIGPNGLALLENADHIEQIAELGVVLLLFLAGLHLQPNKLVQLFSEAALLTFGTSVLFALATFAALQLTAFSLQDCLVISAAMMFSSTVIALKLIPTTTLHHRHTGEVMTSVLLLQDVLAILVLLFLSGNQSGHILSVFGLMAVKLALLALAAFAGVRFLVIPLFRKFGVIHEYTFLVTLAWCLLIAETAEVAGLSYAMGAFIAGISIASNQIALVIAEHLNPLKEFFLILFFFSIGAQLEFPIPLWVLVASALAGIALVFIKTYTYRWAFALSKEPEPLARELGVRLGQGSEFGILIAYTGLAYGALSTQGAAFIQVTTMVSFVVSTYWVVWKYPTPVSPNPKMRQN